MLFIFIVHQALFVNEASHGGSEIASEGFLSYVRIFLISEVIDSDMASVAFFETVELLQYRGD